MPLHDHLIVKTMPVANPKNIISGNGYRITVLTERLLRVEKQKKGIFCDDATQYIWNRNFPEVKYTVEQTGKMLLITTKWAKFFFDPFAKDVTSVYLNGRWVDVKHAKNFGGTCRTLDNSLGRVRLGKGLLADKGVSLIEDNSLLLVDGEVRPRKAKGKDKYIFAYGRNYRDALTDFFFMTGEVPLLPRYVLGNWWSRYHAYTQKEYIDLMDAFAERKLPFTVATVDMDWHWVKVKETFPETVDYGKGCFQGPGWTGYSWNTDLFPDPKAFLDDLHKRNLRVTLNLHPSSGVRCFEDRYEEMATAMGIDPKTKKAVPFDITDPKFINNYFDVLHHPMENEGVDFWWMDWQQGTKTKIKGLDPLWSLNHYHFLDSARENKRGIILSRYSGIGSHRYPLGFSGDTFTRWSALRFQPEFTNKAANVGYGWWSHDIGGHMMGFTDDEMYVRWCQYGVFSPINRLHSSTNELQAKEPWKHSEQSRKILSDFLRLRHALIPYLYTENYRAHTTGRALCEPMYYDYGRKKGAYQVPNEYTFGTQLIVSPIVRKHDKRLNMAWTDVWLPDGQYTDIFTGRRYEGGRKFRAFRDMEFYPVFAKAGAILPLSGDEGNDCGNPKNLKLWLFRGNGEYTLYEDDGISNDYKNGKFANSRFTVKETGGVLTFTAYPAEGDTSVIPEGRKITLCLRDVIGGKVFINGKQVPFSTEIVLPASQEETVVSIEDFVPTTNGDLIENAKVVLSRWQKSNHTKLLSYLPLKNKKTPEEYFKAVQRQIMFPKILRDAVKEVFLP